MLLLCGRRGLDIRRDRMPAAEWFAWGRVRFRSVTTLRQSWTSSFASRYARRSPASVTWYARLSMLELSFTGRSVICAG